jgi:hypothetical protein
VKLLCRGSNRANKTIKKKKKKRFYLCRQLSLAFGSKRAFSVAKSREISMERCLLLFAALFSEFPLSDFSEKATQEKMKNSTHFIEIPIHFQGRFRTIHESAMRKLRRSNVVKESAIGAYLNSYEYMQCPITLRTWAKPRVLPSHSMKCAKKMSFFEPFKI